MKKLKLLLPILLLFLFIGGAVRSSAADTYPRLEIDTLPDNLVYGLNEKLDKTGLSVTLRETENSGIGGYTTDEISCSYDFSVPGHRTVTAKIKEGGKWYSTTFTAYVLPYTRTLQPSSGYPSYTRYGNNTNNTQTYTCTGAKGLLLQFSASSKLEDGGDYVYVYDGTGKLLASYTGTELSGRKLFISGDSFSIKLRSDEDTTSYGYYFTSIWAVNASSCTHVYGEEAVTAATCDKDGKIVKTCMGCDYVSTTVLPKLTADGEHSYDYSRMPEDYYRSYAYASYWDLYYTCETCGQKNWASGYPYDPDHDTCGNWVKWALFDSGDMVIFITDEYGSWDSYSMTSVPDKAANAKRLYIQDGIVGICSYAFDDAGSLTSVRFPATLETVGSYAFRNCRSLQEVSLPAALTSIGDYAFYSCDDITSVSFGNCSPTVGRYAFSYCTGLTSVDFGRGNVTLGELSFSDCEALKTVDIPATVTLGKSSFYSCAVLESATVRCADIPDYTFESCRKLSSVRLMGTETIGRGAFNGTESLTSITFPATLETLEEYAFNMQGGSYPALNSATFLSAETVINGNPFNGVRNGNFTVRGPGCSTAARFAQLYGYPFSATDTSSHNLQSTPAVTPTCQQEGFTEGESCTVCGYVTRVRTSLGMGDHEITHWVSISDDEHRRGCVYCTEMDETAAHERELGLCSVCGDDDLSHSFSNGTLTLFCPQGGTEGLVVITAVYNSAGQMLSCTASPWTNGPVHTVTIPEVEGADHIKVFFHSAYRPVRPLLPL